MLQTYVKYTKAKNKGGYFYPNHAALFQKAHSQIKVHPLLIVGNKNEEIHLTAGFMCKCSKRQLPAKKEIGFRFTITFSVPQCQVRRYEVVPAYLWMHGR